MNLKQHVTGADVSAFATHVVLPGTVTNPKMVYHPSRSEGKCKKYLSGPSKRKIKCGDYVGCGSKFYLTMDCNKKHVPKVVAKIDTALAKMLGNNKLWSQKRDHAKQAVPKYDNFNSERNKVIRTRILAIIEKVQDKKNEQDHGRNENRRGRNDCRQDNDL